VAHGEKPGFPRFQGGNRYHSCTDKAYDNGARLVNGSLVLSTIGRLAVRWSRPVAGAPKTVTLSREADGWYASCSCAAVPVAPLPFTGRETGIDVGLKVLLITADGDIVEHPRHQRKSERALKKAHTRVSRRKKDCHRRAKAARQCAKRHQQVRRQRRDFHHKTALALVRAYDTLDVEAIQAADLSRRPAPLPSGSGGHRHNSARRKAGLYTRIHDAGWSAFLTLLTFKAAGAGKRVEAVDPAYTSQDGSGCGAWIQKRLAVRPQVCMHCGLVLDRDANAARAIFWRGRRLRGLPALAGGMHREPVGLEPRRSVGSRYTIRASCRWVATFIIRASRTARNVR
jgi:putative transposase